MTDLLTKIESFYLNILRVLILLAATVALVVFAFGLAKTAPNLFGGMDKTPPKVENAGLGQYITEKRAEGTIASEADGGTQAATTVLQNVPQNIKDASDILAKYINKNNGFSFKGSDIEPTFMQHYDEISFDYQEAYGDSLKALMQELSASKGAPLSGAMIDQLITWHFEKFKAATEAKDAEKARKAAEANQSLLWAGVSLLAFLFLTFCFIFIKIERNLRTAKISA